MTAIRGEAAVGPLDIGMVALAGLAFILSFRRSAILELPDNSKSPIRNLYQEPVAKFWLLTIPVLIASTLVNVGSGRIQFELFGRDALSLIASIVTTIALSAAYMSRYRRALVYGFCVGAAAVTVSYLALAVSGNGYNANSRFVGASINPNQTALHALAIITVCFFATESTQRKPSRLFRAILTMTMLGALVFGLATLSDAFVLAIVPGLIAVGMTNGVRMLGSAQSAIFAVIIASAIAMITVQISSPDLLPAAWDDFSDRLSAGGQATDRVTLWYNGLLAWYENILLGNGIGAWSGFSGPFEGMEAHNNLVDWLSVVGLVGISFNILFLFSIIRFPIKERLDKYLFFLMIFIYGLFGFYFRSPIYWMSLIVLLNNEAAKVETMIRQKIAQ